MRPLLLNLVFTISAIGAVHTVVNEVNYHTFSRHHPILARIHSGDRVVTKTVDSAGFDLNGVRHTKTHGNPLTGPFYIEGAEPGDALVVHLDRVRLNRTTGYTAFRVNALTDKAREKYAPAPYTEGAVLPGRTDLIPFVIDLKNNNARPKDSLSTRADLTFRALPMLGCIGVAPDSDPPPTSGPAGAYGGNLDYREIREGATVIVPVIVPGGYFFVGDGHALQGDGEAVGSGIETSLDVEFTVTLRKNAQLTEPRVETIDELISIGARTATNKSLNDALAIATSDMMRWLIDEYGVEPVAAHLLIGHQAKYDVVALSGVMAIRIPKRVLRKNR
ncbi:MAG TPA: acetamidase/formamidase family protein [Bryobacteraceae bacterium]|nr:acetamidase/formamidase family protein [Bryobacteraceae bacterium]